jgi:hypothetical protein
LPPMKWPMSRIRASLNTRLVLRSRCVQGGIAQVAPRGKRAGGRLRATDDDEGERAFGRAGLPLAEEYYRWPGRAVGGRGVSFLASLASVSRPSTYSISVCPSLIPAEGSAVRTA